MTNFLKAFGVHLAVSFLLIIALWVYSQIHYQAGYKAAYAAWELRDEKRQKQDAFERANRQA